MKIRVVLEIDLDPANWDCTYQASLAEVRKDVKSYIEHSVRTLAAIEDAEAEVTLR